MASDAKQMGNCAFVAYYAARSGNFLPTFRDNLWVPSIFWGGFSISEDGPMGCPATSVRNYHYSLLNNPEERSPQMRVYYQ